MNIVNLTPHGVNVVGQTGDVIASFPPSGKEARAVQKDSPVGVLDLPGGGQVELVRSQFGLPTDLPEPAIDTYYVVSVLTAQAARASRRTTEDLLVSSGLVRDATGQIVGCRKFALL